MLTDQALRAALLDALTQDNRLHLTEVSRVANRLQVGHRVRLSHHSTLMDSSRVA